MSKKYTCTNCKTLVVDTRRQGVNDLCTECDAKFNGLFQFKVNPYIPKDHIWFEQDGKIVGKIINIGDENNVT